VIAEDPAGEQRCRARERQGRNHFVGYQKLCNQQRHQQHGELSARHARVQPHEYQVHDRWNEEDGKAIRMAAQYMA
jgi:hypothetical protein